MKRFTNTEASVVIDAKDAADLISQAKSQGLVVGKKPAQELWDGKRDNAGGFEFLEDLVEEEAPVEEPAAPKASDADEKNNFSDDAVAAAVEEAKANGMPVQTEKPAEEKAPVVTAPKKAKEMRASAPQGKIKPVRKDTKIARGLEALAGGVTLEELLAVNVGDDPVDFVNRRVTKRGYGIALAEGKISLVFPEGVTAVAYSG